MAEGDERGGYDATGERSRKALAAAAADAERQLDGPCGKAVASLAKDGRAVQVVGRLVEGKLEIDQSALEEFARRFPDANATFVAVNAPFDPEFSSTLLNA